MWYAAYITGSKKAGKTGKVMKQLVGVANDPIHLPTTVRHLGGSSKSCEADLKTVPIQQKMENQVGYCNKT